MISLNNSQEILRWPLSHWQITKCHWPTSSLLYIRLRTNGIWPPSALGTNSPPHSVMIKNQELFQWKYEQTYACIHVPYILQPREDLMANWGFTEHASPVKGLSPIQVRIWTIKCIHARQWMLSNLRVNQQKIWLYTIWSRGNPWQ